MRREWANKITFAVNPADQKKHLVFTSGNEPVSYKHPLLEAAPKSALRVALGGAI
jgi:hypothetical protein